MEFNLDNFITYSDSPVLFPNENFPDFDFPMLSPFQNPSPSPGHQQNFSSSYPDSLNPSNSSPPSTNSYSTGSRLQAVNKKDSKELKQISNKTKTVQKRNSAKARAKVKHDTEKVLENAAKKFITADLEDPNLDLKTKRHLIQKVKNRIAAQKSRDSKKNYITELEEIRDRLQEEARDLNTKNNFLLEKVKELELARMQLLAENEGLRRRNVEQDIQSNEECLVNLKPMASPEEENNQQLEGDINTVLTRQTHQKNNCLGYFVSFTAILAIYWGFKMAHIGILQSGGQVKSMHKVSLSPSTYTSNLEIVNTSLEISNEDASSQEKVVYTFTEQMKSDVRYRIEVAHQADDQAIAESAKVALKLMSDQNSKKTSEKIGYYYPPQTAEAVDSHFESDTAGEPPFYYYPSESNLSPNYSLSPIAGSAKSYGFGSTLVFSICPLLLFLLYWL